MATQLKTISDSIGKVFENQSYVFSYGSESISYNDSLAIRGAILAIEFKLDFVASYSWGDDEDIKTRTVYEYQNISVNPATVLNSVKGSGSYELVEEWEEYTWDDAKWQSNHSYTGDVTTYSKKYYVDLSKLLNSSYAVDITSLSIENLTEYKISEQNVILKITAEKKIINNQDLKKVLFFVNKEEIVSNKIYYENGFFEAKDMQIEFKKGYFLEGVFIMIDSLEKYKESNFQSKKTIFKYDKLEFEDVFIKIENKEFKKLKYSIDLE